jgi:hypothetical protein
LSQKRPGKLVQNFKAHRLGILLRENLSDLLPNLIVLFVVVSRQLTFFEVPPRAPIQLFDQIQFPVVDDVRPHRCQISHRVHNQQF